MSYSRFFATLLTTCVLSTAAFANQPASTKDGSAPVTRAELPALIKEALLNDPSILMEVVEKMQAEQANELSKKAKEGIIKYKDQIFNDPNTPSVGPADADVSVVEFFDYHCGYCKQALGSIIKLLESDKKVRVVFKEFPILSEDSRYGAKAALAVHRIAKDKYFDFHKAMYTVKGKINEAFVLAEAAKLGIDANKLKAEIANPEIEKIIDADKDLGMKLGVQGTPAIIIGEKLFPGAVPLEVMQKAIAELRNPSKAAEPAKK